MQLVEQHCIRKHDPRSALIDEAAFASKNLYNLALYEWRQAFLHEGKYLSCVWPLGRGAIHLTCSHIDVKIAT